MISIHALRVEGDLDMIAENMYRYSFLSTPSGWRATKVDYEHSDLRKFLSTPSGWRATIQFFTVDQPDFNFYPRPPGGGRRYYQTDGAKKGRISIHALRVEGDRQMDDLILLISISIHALRVEGDSLQL